MIERWINWYNGILSGTELSDKLVVFIDNATIVIITVTLALAADYISKRIIIGSITKVAKRSKNNWDDVFVQKKVFNRLAHLAPAVIVYSSFQYIFDADSVVTFLENMTQAFMVVVVIMVIDAMLNALLEIYNNLPISKGRNIKGYIQVVMIIFTCGAVILIISIFTGDPPMKLLAGLGAMAAVLMLVFQDTILGFVASIQLSSNQMVNVGDWISMPKYNADGNVIDISLNTVKVQNWDKTIATIPTYALISQSFNNWKGMEDSGGRRIKRSINIDMNSVTFLNATQIEKFRKFYLLKDYISDKEKEIAEFNKSLSLKDGTVTNGRKMTNLGTFRKYIEEYLKHHPKIHQDMTFLIRHLQPTDKGLPLEIYVFSNDQAWANYEAIQADIFDHTLAILPEFDLNVFQSPTGTDFQNIIE